MDQFQTFLTISRHHFCSYAYHPPTQKLLGTFVDHQWIFLLTKSYFVFQKDHSYYKGSLI